MNADLEAIFAHALELDGQARISYLNDACAENQALRDQVEKLLQAHAEAGSFLEIPALGQVADADSPLLETPRSAASSLDLPTQGFSLVDPDGRLDGLLQPSLVPGSLGRLGHYEVQEVLGSGAFGTVVRAIDDKLKRTVAIKLMSAELAATSPARKRFSREAQSAAAIRNEHVMQIYSVEESPIPYIVMEYIPGATLDQRLNQHGPLSVPEVLRLGQQMASGLAGPTSWG